MHPNLDENTPVMISKKTPGKIEKTWEKQNVSRHVLQN